MTRKKSLVLALTGTSLAVIAAGTVPAAATSTAVRGSVPLRAELAPLNDSGVHGTATARVTGGGNLRRIAVQAHGLTPEGPHAIHIHFGAQAAHECPTFRDDANKDFRINVAEGVPQYGPIAMSITRTGDTTPASALALDRMAVARDGHLRVARVNQRFTDLTDVDGAVIPARAVGRAIRAGQGVVVVHGIDYSGDGAYGESAAGASELDPSGATPAEATDPAACGVLRRLPDGHNH